MGYYYNDMSFFGGFFMILFWALIIWGIFAVVRMLGSGSCNCHGHHGQKDNALSILKERYAKGEIDKAEFEQKKKDLVSD